MSLRVLLCLNQHNQGWHQHRDFFRHPMSWRKRIPILSLHVILWTPWFITIIISFIITVIITRVIIRCHLLLLRLSLRMTLIILVSNFSNKTMSPATIITTHPTVTVVTTVTLALLRQDIIISLVLEPILCPELIHWLLLLRLLQPHSVVLLPRPVLLLHLLHPMTRIQWRCPTTMIMLHLLSDQKSIALSSTENFVTQISPEGEKHPDNLQPLEYKTIRGMIKVFLSSTSYTMMWETCWMISSKSPTTWLTIRKCLTPIFPLQSDLSQSTQHPLLLSFARHVFLLRVCRVCLAYHQISRLFWLRKTWLCDLTLCLEHRQLVECNLMKTCNRPLQAFDSTLLYPCLSSLFYSSSMNPFPSFRHKRKSLWWKRLFFCLTLFDEPFFLLQLFLSFRQFCLSLVYNCIVPFNSPSTFSLSFADLKICFVSQSYSVLTLVSQSVVAAFHLPLSFLFLFSPSFSCGCCSPSCQKNVRSKEAFSSFFDTGFWLYWWSLVMQVCHSNPLSLLSLQFPSPYDSLTKYFSLPSFIIPDDEALSVYRSLKLAKADPSSRSTCADYSFEA